MFIRLLTLLASVSYAATVTCPDNYKNLYGDACYRLSEDVQTLRDARTRCQSEGGDIVSIHAQEENVALTAAVGESTIFWIGLRCNETSSSYFWSDGTPLDYKNCAHDCSLCNNSYGYTISPVDDGRWFPFYEIFSINYICKIN